MSDDAPANTPIWLRWAVPAFLLAVAVLLVIAHRAQWQPDWINVAAQLALAALLFWYVLETRRVANETRRLALQSEHSLPCYENRIDSGLRRGLSPKCSTSSATTIPRGTPLSMPPTEEGRRSNI